MTSSRFLLILATVGVVQRAAPTAHAQVTLRAALAEAERAGYVNRIAAGNTAAQRAEALAPLKAILPSIRVEAGYMRSNDPAVLGSATMRAVTNYPAGIVVEQPLLNADAWMGRRAALHAAGATYAAGEWARLSTRVDVVRAYYGAVLAAERVTALQAAARAAHAHVAQAEAMVKQGLVTKSDALLASVRSGDVDAQLAEAEGAAATTQRQLAIVLGRTADELPNDFIRAKQLPPTERIRAEVAGDTLLRAGDSRADVRAATDAFAAARGDVRRAKASLLPRLNGFVRYDWSSPSGLYAGDRRSTVGVMGSWSPFGGASELADVEATTGRARAAEAQAEAARANALVEIEQTRIALSVALTRLDIAERAATQSAEAHRIVSRKYSGGLAGVVELLDAQAVETQSVLGLSQARWAAIVAAAERRRALGLDPASLATLDDASAVATHDARPDR
jgi:outer membrane protein TolC